MNNKKPESELTKNLNDYCDLLEIVANGSLEETSKIEQEAFLKEYNKAMSKLKGGKEILKKHPIK